MPRRKWIVLGAGAIVAGALLLGRHQMRSVVTSHAALRGTGPAPEILDEYTNAAVEPVDAIERLWRTEGIAQEALTWK
jgi:hypothetical protein